MSVLTDRGGWKRYRDHSVLRGIDLEVEPHEVVCLIGASGSGKSTLLRCVNLLEAVDDGAISFDGEEITEPRVDGGRGAPRMGMVFQAYNLFPHLAVLANVTLAPRKVHGAAPRRRGPAGGDAGAGRARGEGRGPYPDRLSGGQQQRVAIVRALAAKPAADAARRGHLRARPRRSSPRCSA